MRKLVLGGAFIAAMSMGPAFANPNTPLPGAVCGNGQHTGNPHCATTSVPEISAMQGGAAIAALLALMALAWERRRNAVL